MLATSSSLFRTNEDSGYRQLVGRANRMLHYKDLLAFKELGYEVYDYGGLGDFNDELKAIAEFKLGFGGEVKTYDASFTLHFKTGRLVEGKIGALRDLRDKRIVIYGYGRIGKCAANRLESFGIRDYMVIDNYAESDGGTIYYKDEDLASLDKERTLVLMSLREKTFTQIEDKLNDLGYKVGDNIITLLF